MESKENCRAPVLTQDELTVLEAVKEANPWYFKALIYSARVVPQRRRMYSGNSNPFTNFQIAARIRNSTVDEVFQWYIALKAARIEVSKGDHGDENSFYDTLRDWANYVLLWLGYRMFEESNP